MPESEMRQMFRRRSDLDDPDPPALQAVIRNDATDIDSKIFVTVPSIHPHHKRGPCPWQPRAVPSGIQLPSRGDHALVMFDDENQPWIVMWEPT